MFNQIIGTLSSRGLSAVMLFVIIMLTSHFFGTEGRAEIVVFSANMNIGILLSSLFAGTIIYLSSKFDTTLIAIYSFFWIIVVALFFTLFFLWFYPLKTALLSGFSILVGGVFESNLNVLSAKNKLNKANILKFLQVLFCLIFTFGIIFYQKSVWFYIAGFVLSYLLVVLVSFIGIFDFEKIKIYLDKNLIKQAFNLGFWALIANVFGLLSSRFLLYFLNSHFDKNIVGIYGNAFNLIDAIWIIGNSLAFVLYVNLSKPNNEKEQYWQTLLFAKISLLATALVLGIITALSNKVFILLFGEKFMHLKATFLHFSAYILLSVLLMKMSAYFASKGKIKVNAFGAIIGFFSTVIFSFLLASKQANNAALVLAFSYAIMLCWSFWNFYQINDFIWKDWLISKNDINFLIQKWKTNVWNRRNYK